MPAITRVWTSDLFLTEKNMNQLTLSLVNFIRDILLVIFIFSNRHGKDLKEMKLIKQNNK